jgi:hypothetical protein
VRVPDEAIGDLYVARDMKLFDETELPGGIEVLSGDRVSVVGGSWQGYEAVVESRVRRSAGLRIVGRAGSHGRSCLLTFCGSWHSNCLGRPAGIVGDRS